MRNLENIIEFAEYDRSNRVFKVKSFSVSKSFKIFKNWVGKTLDYFEQTVLSYESSGNMIS